MLVMDHITRRMSQASSGPVMHGYMGFDPLREVAFRNGKTEASPLETARVALVDHGFLGIKLYPPMGFRPAGNRPPYPDRVVKMLGLVPDEQLDTALRDLYSLCVDLDAPLLTHGSSSNGSGPGYEKRGDPAYWIPVWEEYPALRVCMAHFGRFDAVSAGREATGLPEGSWEWRLGEFVRRNPGRNIFADVSYFSEVLTSTAAEQRRLAGLFTTWINTFDQGCDHIVYGSDWIMLGKEQGYRDYATRVNAFLRVHCGLSDDACDKIFRRNALRFLPLEKGTPGRDRLLRYYSKHGLDESRLPSASMRLVADIFGR